MQKPCKIYLIIFLVVELPDEPDGKKFEVLLEHEGCVEAGTQTSRHITVIPELFCTLMDKLLEICPSVIIQ